MDEAHAVALSRTVVAGRGGDVYAAAAPTAWDVDFQTAVAQAEQEDREVDGAYHLLAFAGPGGTIAVDTTRPELLPATPERAGGALGRQGVAERPARLGFVRSRDSPAGASSGMTRVPPAPGSDCILFTLSR